MMGYSWREVRRFASVGAIGFGVNLAVLVLLHDALGVNLIVAQLIAAETAIVGNFALHHNWTYSNFAAQKLLPRFAKFNASSASGSLITLGGLALGVQVFHLHYLPALIAGAGAGMLWNLTMNKLVIWKLLHDREASERPRVSLG